MKVEVVSYDPSWPVMFESEAALIKQALGSNCIAIHHIGSTSVSGLSAKPIIDILPVVKNILEVDTALVAMENLGYEAKGEYGIVFRRFFKKGQCHVHVYEENDSEISRYLKFRDWMRSHEADAEAYANLKLELAAKFPSDILSYCFGKDAFVAMIDKKDGFEGSRMVQALTDREWAAVRSLCKDVPSESKDHIHFVFYKNADIVGYAHLNLGLEKEAALQMMVIGKPYRHLGFEEEFSKLCERWLSHQGR